MGKLELYIDYFKDKLFSKKEKEKKNEIDLEEERFEKWLFQKDNEWADKNEYCEIVL